MFACDVLCYYFILALIVFVVITLGLIWWFNCGCDFLSLGFACGVGWNLVFLLLVVVVVTVVFYFFMF